MSYDESFAVLMDIEKGYSNRKDDYGGETKYGITKKSYPSLDIKNLTIEKAKDIYYKDFWLKYHLDKVTSAMVATQLLLIVVNLSPLSSGKVVQNSIIRLGTKIAQDGIIGMNTISMVNQFPEIIISDSIRIELVNFYIGRVTMDVTQKVNFEGWIRRAML